MIWTRRSSASRPDLMSGTLDKNFRKINYLQCRNIIANFKFHANQTMIKASIHYGFLVWTLPPYLRCRTLCLLR